MSRRRTLCLLAAFALATPVLPAAEGDSLETTVQAVYAVISGPAGTRDWAKFRSLFTAGARLIPVRHTAEGNTPRVMTPDDYVQMAGANFEKTAFFETEVSHKVERYGAIAHVFSTYESRRAPGEKPFARGINSFQLVFDGKDWKVMTILWDSERPETPIPDKYLTK
ncbi:hypothetical protein [uncultured Paludibaculum sp.]|uniref:hypothetical protein n=1 Tax=uncultured Paludibaculum sp. TaxID=1765020 RepID=UPI002AAB2FF5|nr:hypothetical protein [uncultured Paludibaculum sp.]